ncbi:MAG: NADPH-dependent FMN reductase, partial [Flavobacteriales bacterium]
MISIISGTNRPNSNSLRVSEYYSKLLLEHGFENQILNLEQLPADFVVNDSFGSRSEVMSDIIATYVQPVEHFIFVIPEYNGSFPGVLKAFIDCLPPSDLHHKSSALVGLSSGYAGGARAMDQFTNVLNYLKVNVNYCKPKLSGIDGLIIG